MSLPCLSISVLCNVSVCLTLLQVAGRQTEACDWGLTVHLCQSLHRCAVSHLTVAWQCLHHDLSATGLHKFNTTRIAHVFDSLGLGCQRASPVWARLEQTMHLALIVGKSACQQMLDEADSTNNCSR